MVRDFKKQQQITSSKPTDTLSPSTNVTCKCWSFPLHNGYEAVRFMYTYLYVPICWNHIININSNILKYVVSSVIMSSTNISHMLLYLQLTVIQRCSLQNVFLINKMQMFPLPELLKLTNQIANCLAFPLKPSNIHDRGIYTLHPLMPHPSTHFEL